MNRITRRSVRWGVLVVGAAALAMAACGSRSDAEGAPKADAETMETSAPTNRVDIPVAVRRNLGVTFARVETRRVAQTIRVPGSFELTPTARREYRAPVPGRIELLVEQFQPVEAGTPLYRVDSAEWRDLHERIAATQARVDSMGPVREAHQVHEQSLADKVQLWQDRLAQLEELRAAGGGSAALFTEARATLNATQAELADLREKDAELEADQKVLEAELRSLESRHDLLVASSACGDSHGGLSPGAGLTMCAVAPGIVETIGITPGGLAEESGLVLTVVQPDQIRFRARGMQSDLGRLRDGLPALIAPPQGGAIDLQDAMPGTLAIGLTADADERTVDLIVDPERIASWARAGVSAHLEVTLAGGSEELAIPVSAVVRDGVTLIIFRRDPANPDKAIRMEADTGISDGRWIVLKSGVKEGDEIVLAGNYQLMLATSGTASKGGHFHPDGTFHEGDH
jgi:hypothetical protein